jgi:predicted nucleic acid-binding protein
VSHTVVFDVNVLVGAVVAGRSDFESWPSPPPTSDNSFADCVGIANDAREFSLWLSEHILENVVDVLTDPNDGFGWETEVAEEYVNVLWDIAEASGGGVTEPRERVSDCSDFEDNRILELALECNADLIVSDDKHLTSMSPWRGRPILRPHEFVVRTDAMRRAERRSQRG